MMTALEYERELNSNANLQTGKHYGFDMAGMRALLHIVIGIVCLCALTIFILCGYAGWRFGQSIVATITPSTALLGMICVSSGMACITRLWAMLKDGFLDSGILFSLIAFISFCIGIVIGSVELETIKPAI